MSRAFTIVIPEECCISAIYDAVAIAAGKTPACAKYDCRRILVSKDIFDTYCAYMESEGQKDSIGAHWLLFGPKVSESLPPSTVEIQEGFFTAIKE